MSRALDQAKHMAAMYRRAGYPNARAAPEYCIDELGSDGFYTYTVSVYVGDKDPATVSPLYKRLTQKLGLSL
jgi:hypothetical protein